MRKIKPSGKIYISSSSIKGAGRGVFATQKIKSGEIIEICPVIEVPLADSSNDDEKGLLTNYFFYFGKALATVLGCGSLYNHSYEPNATYVKRPSERVIEFISIRDIEPNEEIVVNYNNGDPKNKTPIGRGVPNP